MSIATLVQVYDEMRRLAIAGSTVASGDFRLKKLVPPLQKAGEKAPVFAKVGQAVQAVVDSNEKTASAALLELTTLVNAILYTQGETGIAGEFKPLETTNLGGQATQASARVLKPLLEALSSTGSGRIELVKDAFERGTFKDLRLVKPALAALDDPYPEIGTFVAEKVLPLYGKAILPEIRAKLDIKGKSGHLHRLELMHKLDPEGSRDIIQQALSEGSKEMKVAAIECLGTADADLIYLLDQSKAKAKDVRAAALRALTAAESSSPDVIAALKKAIDGADLELIVEKLRQSKQTAIQDYVLEQAEKQFEETVKSRDKKFQGIAVDRMQKLISSLAKRTDAKAEAFILKCFEKAPTFAAIKSEPSGSDLNELVAHVMAYGTPKMQKQLTAAHESLNGPALSSAIFAARATLSAAEFYEQFSPLLTGLADKKVKKKVSERGELLIGALGSHQTHYFYHHSYYQPWMGSIRRDEDDKPLTLTELDPRWLDSAVEAGSVDLVCELARPGHAKTNQFLLEKLDKLKRTYESLEVLQTMVRIGHPEAANSVIVAIKKQAKETSHYYTGYWYGRMIPDLPKSTLPAFEELLPTLPDKLVDQLLESVTALKNKAE